MFAGSNDTLIDRPYMFCPEKRELAAQLLNLVPSIQDATGLSNPLEVRTVLGPPHDGLPSLHILGRWAAIATSRLK